LLISAGFISVIVTGVLAFGLAGKSLRDAFDSLTMISEGAPR